MGWVSLKDVGISFFSSRLIIIFKVSFQILFVAIFVIKISWLVMQSSLNVTNPDKSWQPRNLKVTGSKGHIESFWRFKHDTSFDRWSEITKVWNNYTKLVWLVYFIYLSFSSFIFADNLTDHSIWIWRGNRKRLIVLLCENVLCFQ